MATIESLRKRKNDIVQQFNDNAEFVDTVQQIALDEVIPELMEELKLDEGAVSSASKFVQDRVTVFRFCRRARFSTNAALKLLHATLTWRTSSSLRTLTPASIPSVYLSNPLFFFHPNLIDRFGRPCAVLNLRHVQRTEDGKLDALKDLSKLGWEIGRRWLSDLSRSRRGQEPTLQMVVIVDLDQAGMSNLEMELLPFFMDLLKSHFPGMVGAIFVLNYGWAYAGMWQLAKRVLPNTALERILFPSKEELLEFFDEDHLLVEHGGNVRYEYDPSNPILEKYGQLQTESANHSRAPSTNVSSTSLRSDVFQSAGDSNRSVPPALSRRTSGLTMTSSKATPPPSSSWFGSWGRGSKQAETEVVGGGGPLRRVRSLAELQAKLEETQRELDSEDSIDSEGEDEEDVDETQSENAGGTGESGYPSTSQSRRSSRYSSRATSRATSRETSPARRRGLEPLSTTVTDTALSEHAMRRMSPYNASNPHFGYPAVVPSSRIDPSGIPRPHHHKRKRDLLRTLTYLAALRFLALHRAIRYRLSIIFATLFKLTGLGLLRPSRRQQIQAQKRDEKDLEKTLKVHWSAETTGSGSIPSSPVNNLPRSQSYVDPLYLYFALLFVLVRTPNRRDKIKRFLRFSALDLPRRALQESKTIALRVLVGKEKTKLLLQELKTSASRA
ncbi:SEC14 family lipid-binding protein [Sporobolomyces salmoneus]|uniref:SEC14 family lipid-binding protein n=1 Tax=Sporobolomyces salmoneus TaxID=183962 RepID=UPI0031718C86